MHTQSVLNSFSNTRNDDTSNVADIYSAVTTIVVVWIKVIFYFDIILTAIFIFLSTWLLISAITATVKAIIQCTRDQFSS